jgi:PIN domain nuclease of toxin-antitoxin system
MARAPNLLLDTHVFLWWMADAPELRRRHRDAITSAELVFVSLASAWEVAIKVALGRLRLPEPFGEGVARSGFEPLPISFEHTEAVARLPPHHRDPFDRMLVAQAQAERLTLLTSDRQLEPYDAELILA